MNQPMFKYSQDNGFSTMNYILAGLCLLILLNPTDILLKERQMRQKMGITGKESTEEESDEYDSNEKIEESAEF